MVTNYNRPGHRNAELDAQGTARPDSVKAFATALRVANRACDLERILALETDLQAAFPENIHAMRILGDSHAQRFDWDGAYTCFERARALDGDKFSAHVEPGVHYRRTILHRFGIARGNQMLPTLLNTAAFNVADPGEGDEAKPFVFIAGLPRSGTTALGDLLNLSPDVCIFTELYSPFLSYGPASFHRESIEARLAVMAANISDEHRDQIQAYRNKAVTARWIGDKRPLFQFCLPQTLQALSDETVYVLYLVRDYADIARSYQARADNPEDGWSPFRDVRQLVREINLSNAFLADLPANGLGRGRTGKHRLIFVDYEKVFREFDYVAGLFDELGLELSTHTRMSVDQFLAQSAPIMKSRPSAPDSVLSVVSAQIDHSAARAVDALCGIEACGTIGKSWSRSG